MLTEPGIELETFTDSEVCHPTELSRNDRLKQIHSL